MATTCRNGINANVAVLWNVTGGILVSACEHRIVGKEHVISNPLKAFVLKQFGRIASAPFRLRQPEISEPKNVSHDKWRDYLSAHFNKENVRILEIGSRNVTGANLRHLFDKADYIGFDFYPGENVDVVGDAHKLSSYFEDAQFDLIFSSAVFEHLHMPWVVSTEIEKLLKVGGHVFIETHFSHSSHERPWHFFQFSDMGLRALFNDAMGFDLVDSGMSNPIFGYFGHQSDRYLRYGPVTELYCHSEILCRKREPSVDFAWEKVLMDSIVQGTRYPLAQTS